MALTDKTNKLLKEAGIQPTPKRTISLSIIEDGEWKEIAKEETA